MTKLHVIEGTPAPDTPLERVRKRVRASAEAAGIIHCPRCGKIGWEWEYLGGVWHGRTPVGATKRAVCTNKKCIGPNGERIEMV